MTAFMAGGVSADACSVLLTCSREAQTLIGSRDCHPAGREGSGAEYNGNEFARAVGLPVIACSVDGALLTTISSKRRQFAHQTLSARSAEVWPPAGRLSCQVRSQGSRRDRVGFYSLSQPEDSVVSHLLLTPPSSWKTKARA